jgi:hypothetical protein
MKEQIKIIQYTVLQFVYLAGYHMHNIIRLFSKQATGLAMENKKWVEDNLQDSLESFGVGWLRVAIMFD